MNNVPTVVLSYLVKESKGNLEQLEQTVYFENTNSSDFEKDFIKFLNDNTNRIEISGFKTV